MMLKMNLSLRVGLGFLGLMAAVLIVSFLFFPMNPEKMDLANRMQLPSLRHLLGTDQFGRDILSRIMAGSRAVFTVSLGAVSIGAAAGCVLGAAAAFDKGIFNRVIMSAIDGLMAFPGILLAMMLVTVIGKGLGNAIIAIAVFIIPVFTRLTHSLILESETLLYLKAARSYGASKFYLLSKHILPAVLPRLVTQFSSSAGFAVLTESSLSFLGMGVQPPHASWGSMLSDARPYLMNYPFLPVMPGIAIIVTVLGFHLVGDGLNDFFIDGRHEGSDERDC